MLVSLSPPCEKLRKLMRELKFGWIKNLPIRNGEPVLNPSPVLVYDIKLGSDHGKVPGYTGKRAKLKPQEQELLACFRRMDNGTVKCIEVKHGLPFRLHVKDCANM